MFHDIEIKPAINLDNYCNASVSWELALKAQMSEFGLDVETVAEGVLILIDTLKNHGIEIKLSDDRHNCGVLGASINQNTWQRVKN